MIAYSLILISLASLCVAWKDMGLRLIGFALVIAASVTPWSSELPMATRVYLYVAIDLIGAFAGLWIWSRYQQLSALVFMCAAVACCVAHFSWFLSSQSANAKYSYIAILNVIFIFQCVWIFGDGMWRRARDYGFRRRISYFDLASHFRSE